MTSLAPSSTRAPRVACALAALLLAGALPASADDGGLPDVAAGTRVSFHILAPLVSNVSQTGSTFDFVLLAPIATEGAPVPVEGTTGSGTVFLAGHAGGQGHEGDLTLRLDTVHAVDGRIVVFADQRFRVNGRNRKVASNLLGFVPYVGLAANFIRGSEIRVDPDTPVETVLDRPATVLQSTPMESAASQPATPQPPALPQRAPATSPPSSSPTLQPDFAS